ncbi:MAG: sulfotransferase [Deltaproteobacteria bacterium]|nr:sulfotransferase [Deltaproteobacteria bacterium]MBW2697215.1 sulfotransferase [Deltaproteobacteria bacterium]
MTRTSGAAERGPSSEGFSAAAASVTRVAVLGLYSSGSTATAGVLHHLGARMGKEFWGDFYEPRWLSDQLRGWWSQSLAREVVPAPERIRVLRRWLLDMSADGCSFVAAKHPLLTLCGDDLLEAWGPETKFLWTHRPLEESIASVARRGWFSGHHVELQQALWQTANRFFKEREHLRVEFASMLASPKREVDRIIEFVGVDVRRRARRRAIASIRRDRR